MRGGDQNPRPYEAGTAYLIHYTRRFRIVQCAGARKQAILNSRRILRIGV
jgi:hypothetical protein